MLKPLIIGLVALLIFVNIYYRFKILGTYKKLGKQGVVFSIEHVLNKRKLEKEVLPKYPSHKADILSLANYMSSSFKMSFALLSMIVLFSMAYLYF